MMRSMTSAPVVTRVMIAAIQLYRVTLAAFLGGGCRFYPSCSEYAVQVIERDGPWRGGLKALRRIGRCTPLQPGGLDLP